MLCISGTIPIAEITHRSIITLIPIRIFWTLALVLNPNRLTPNKAIIIIDANIEVWILGKYALIYSAPIIATPAEEAALETRIKILIANAIEG